MPECHGVNATDDDYYSYYLLRVCAAAVRTWESRKERKKERKTLHTTLIVRQWGTSIRMNFIQRRLPIYLNNPHQNGWFLRHSSATPPRLAPANDAVWRCLQCHSQMPAFFSRGWWCRHNDWWRVSRTIWRPSPSSARPVAEEPTYPYVEPNFSSPDVDHISEFIIIIIVPPPAPISLLYYFFIILFRCDMTKIGWMRRLIDCLLRA